MRAAKAMVTQLNIDDQVRPWTGGFWHGLRLSGALRLHAGYPRLQPGRPWLEEDMASLPFPGRLSPPDCQGRRWLVQCHACRLPVANLFGADVLAGLLAGARREKQEDGTWLVLPRTESVVSVLNWWKLSVCQGPKSDELLVLPFYGALLSDLVPKATASSMIVKHAGNCPMLPLAIWQVLWGASGADKGYIMPDRAWAIPYICGHATRVRHHWSPELLYKASGRLGVAHVPVGSKNSSLMNFLG